MTPATATPKAPKMPAPSTGAAAIAPLVPFVAALLDVPVEVPVEDPVEAPLLADAVDIVEPLFPAAPVVAALTALAVALPAVTTTGIYPDLASSPVNVAVTRSPLILIPVGKAAPVANAAFVANAAPAPDDDIVHAAVEVPERAQLMDAP